MIFILFSCICSGGLTGIVIFSALILSPFAGKLSDKVGRRPYLLLCGALAVIPAHLYLSETDWNPIPAIVVIGLSFSLVPSGLFFNCFVSEYLCI